MNLWNKGTCGVCRAGEDTPVDVIRAASEVEVFMCRICVELGLSPYGNQNHRTVTPVDLSRAVRIIHAILRDVDPK